MGLWVGFGRKAALFQHLADEWNGVLSKTRLELQTSFLFQANGHRDMMKLFGFLKE